MAHPFDAKAAQILRNEYQKLGSTCPFPVYVRGKGKNLTKRPCGQCQVCMINSELEKSARHAAEAITTPSAVFTFTLSDKAFLEQNWYSPDTWKRECDNLQRRIRYLTGYKCLVRFVAEAGGETDRPHAHAIIHGIPPHMVPTRQLKYQKVDFWKHGHVTIDKVTPASCRYVIGYITDREKMAKRIWKRTSPGIGFAYIDQWIAHMKEGRKKHGCRYRHYPDKETGQLEMPVFEADHFTYRMDATLKERCREAGLLEDLSDNQRNARSELERNRDMISPYGEFSELELKVKIFDRQLKRYYDVRRQSELKDRYVTSEGYTMYA